MGKYCKHCGLSMLLTLRKLVYKKYEIKNVPIHTCRICDRTEVEERVRPELKKLIHSLEASEQKQKIAFEEFSEYSNLLVMVANETEEEPIEAIIENRINELLELLLLAKSLKDESWAEEISGRLKQVI